MLAIPIIRQPNIRKQTEQPVHSVSRLGATFRHTSDKKWIIITTAGRISFLLLEYSVEHLIEYSSTRQPGLQRLPGYYLKCFYHIPSNTYGSDKTYFLQWYQRGSVKRLKCNVGSLHALRRSPYFRFLYWGKIFVAFFCTFCCTVMCLVIDINLFEQKYNVRKITCYVAAMKFVECRWCRNG